MSSYVCLTFYWLSRRAPQAGGSEHARTSAHYVLLWRGPLPFQVENLNCAAAPAYRSPRTGSGPTASHLPKPPYRWARQTAHRNCISAIWTDLTRAGSMRPSPLAALPGSMVCQVNIFPHLKEGDFRRVSPLFQLSRQRGYQIDQHQINSFRSVFKPWVFSIFPL